MLVRSLSRAAMLLGNTTTNKAHKKSADTKLVAERAVTHETTSPIK